MSVSASGNTKKVLYIEKYCMSLFLKNIETGLFLIISNNI